MCLGKRGVAPYLIGIKRIRGIKRLLINYNAWKVVFMVSERKLAI
jgi:hypothetical protein